MRGYFAIGVEGLSKPMNAGNLFRTAHAFGASFVFTIGADYSSRKVRSDTSNTSLQIPLHAFDDLNDFSLPTECDLVGVELREDAIELPSFKHPWRAAYVLGPERGNLSDELAARCDHLVKIPTSFCVNVATAGAIVMYDRVCTLGKFAERPLAPGARGAPPPVHVQGGQKSRKPRAGR